MSGGQDYSNASMLELFRMEVEIHSSVLSDGLVALANGTAGTDVLTGALRAAHSIKGAARIVGLQKAVEIAHAMEDCFIAAQQKRIVLQPDHVDVLLKGTDYLMHAGDQPASPGQDQHAVILAGLKNMMPGAAPTAAGSTPSGPAASASSPLPAVLSAKPAQPVQAAVAVKATSGGTMPAVRGSGSAPAVSVPPRAKKSEAQLRRTEISARISQSTRAVVSESANAPVSEGGRAVRVSAASLSRLMGLTGEALVDGGWLNQFERSLRNLQIEHQHVAETLERLQHQLGQTASQSPAITGLLHELIHQNSEYQQHLAERVHAFEVFSLRSDNLLHRLYREVIASRMRPFGDGVQSFPRMVHDIARSLDKKVRFQVSGRETEVDRDILEKLEAPLNHLLRNGVDHGMESPADRVAAGKDEQGKIVLQAMHKGGVLLVSVSDDGRGIDVEKVRQKIIERKLSTAEIAAKLTEPEVLEFLFLPGFSTAEKVTEISGRGIGLDVVRTMIQEVGGQIRVSTRLGAGSSFHLQLPITLSVLNALIVEIAGDPYAFPLARIDKLLKIEKEQLQSLENRQYFKQDDTNIGLVTAQQVLGIGVSPPLTGELPVIIIGERFERYGVAVDRVLGERKVVVRPLDARLGKLPNISAASLMEDGRPLLIVDVDDMIQSINRLLSGGGHVDKVLSRSAAIREHRKRVLVVDDSLTVREVERKLLANRGYEVEVAIDGAAGWNTLSSGRFDLVISDVDMPRMNGIELVKRIRADARYKNLPVMIVSYKDREEDRLKGLDAGANYYLAKSSFHDESLLVAVVELIGEPR